jgi:Ca2+-binding RTX toxin-like protein
VGGGTGLDSMIAQADGTVIGISSLTGIETISADGHSGVKLIGSALADVIDLSATTLIGITGIDGGGGRDTIIGSTGADTIIGGGAGDLLTGGGGADTFLFRSITESRPGAKDIITDFTQGQDILHLTTIDANSVLAGNQDFSFIGDAAFSNIAGELRADTGTAGIVRVLGDTNGDGVADFEIQLTITAGMPGPMTVADFML